MDANVKLAPAMLRDFKGLALHQPLGVVEGVMQVKLDLKGSSSQHVTCHVCAGDPTQNISSCM